MYCCIERTTTSIDVRNKSIAKQHCKYIIVLKMLINELSQNLIHDYDETTCIVFVDCMFEGRLFEVVKNMSNLYAVWMIDCKNNHAQFSQMFVNCPNLSFVCLINHSRFSNFELPYSNQLQYTCSTKPIGRLLLNHWFLKQQTLEF